MTPAIPNSLAQRRRATSALLPSLTVLLLAAVAATAAAALFASAPRPTTAIPYDIARARRSVTPNNVSGPNALPAEVAVFPTAPPEQEHRLCRERCPQNPQDCIVKYVYGSGNVFCCSRRLYVLGFHDGLCGDGTIPSPVPASYIVAANSTNSTNSTNSISGGAGQARGSEQQRPDNTHLLTLSHHALNRINTQRISNNKPPLQYNQDIAQCSIDWASYLDRTSLLLSQSPDRPLVPFPNGTVFLGESVLAFRTRSSETDIDAANICADAVVSATHARTISLGGFDMGGVGLWPRLHTDQWICTLSVGSMFLYGGAGTTDVTALA